MKGLLPETTACILFQVFCMFMVLVWYCKNLVKCIVKPITATNVNFSRNKQIWRKNNFKRWQIHCTYRYMADRNKHEYDKWMLKDALQYC